MGTVIFLFIFALVIGAIIFILYNLTSAATDGGSSDGKVIRESYGTKIKIQVADGYESEQFNIVGTSYKRGLDSCVGTWEGTLVPEPENDYDPNAIKVMYKGAKHVGYIAFNDTWKVRKFMDDKLPCDCTGVLKEEEGDDGKIFYWGVVVIVRPKKD